MTRDEFLKIRVAPEEIARWRAAAAAAAAAAGTNLSDWMRGVADLSAADGVVPSQVRAKLVTLRTEMNRGPGNNLNQIAKALHVEPSNPVACGFRYEGALVTAADDIARIRELLERALGKLGAKGCPRRRTTTKGPRRRSPPPATQVAAGESAATTQVPGTALTPVDAILQILDA